MGRVRVHAHPRRDGRALGAEPIPEPAASPALLHRLAAAIGGRPGSRVLVRRGPGVGPERVHAARKAARRACVETFEVEGDGADEEQPAHDE